MMDGLDLFRKLGVGAKFDFKRFRHDAERLKVKTFHDNGKIKQGKDVGQTRKRSGGTDADEPQLKKKMTEEDSEDEEGDGSETDQGSDGDLDSEESNSESDADDGSDDGEMSDAGEKETELQILGSIKAKDGQILSHKRSKKKNKTAAQLAEIQQEKVNHFRNVHHVHIHGTDVPDPITEFQQLVEEYKVQEKIIENVRAAGFTSPTAIQMQAVPAMMMRREILACAPTGSGKTLAFILPILHHLKQPQNLGFRALVLAPTRELAQQIHREFNIVSEGTGFRNFYIEKASVAAKKFGPKSAQKFDVLVTTPNRLVHMLKQEPPAISLKGVEWLVVDESDKLFEEGKYGFRDQLAAIYQACGSPNLRRAFFSATFAFDVEEWCRLNLDNLLQVYIGARNSATKSIVQELQFVGGEAGKLLAVRDIIRKGFNPPVLIFVQSKERAKELFMELIYDGINVDVIHSDRTQTQRENVVKSFRSGRIWVLICTELMGRGIDFKGVNLVINYDFPNSAISYIHRIGRTGRAGREGRAVTFFTGDDTVYLRSIANVMKEAGCPVPEFMLNVKKPKRKDRKHLAKTAPKRKTIRTFPLPDVKKSRKQRKQFKQRNNPQKFPVQKKTDGTAAKTEKVHSTNKKPQKDSTKTSKQKQGEKLKRPKSNLFKKSTS